MSSYRGVACPPELTDAARDRAAIKVVFSTTGSGVDGVTTFRALATAGGWGVDISDSFSRGRDVVTGSFAFSAAAAAALLLAEMPAEMPPFAEPCLGPVGFIDGVNVDGVERAKGSMVGSNPKDLLDGVSPPSSTSFLEEAGLLDPVGSMEALNVGGVERAKGSLIYSSNVYAAEDDDPSCAACLLLFLGTARGVEGAEVALDDGGPVVVVEMIGTGGTGILVCAPDL